MVCFFVTEVFGVDINYSGFIEPKDSSYNFVMQNFKIKATTCWWNSFLDVSWQSKATDPSILFIPLVSIPIVPCIPLPPIYRKTPFLKITGFGH